MSETLMTTEAANTTEGQAASESTEQQAATGAVADGQQQGEQAATEGDKAAEAEAKPEGAPEKYEFKAEEGKEFDPVVIEKFSEVAKELNLSQDNAQKLIDKIAPALAERQIAQLESAKEAWADSARSDKEYGGDKLTENLAVAQKAMNQFGSPELRTLLNESGLGNHPEIIRAFYRAGKAISEDSFVPNGGGNASPADAKSFYPNSNMN